MKFEVSHDPASAHATDLLVLLTPESVIKEGSEETADLLSALQDDPFAIAAQEGFKGKPGQHCILRTPHGIKARRLLLMGVGDGSTAQARLGAQRAGRLVKKTRAVSVSLMLPGADEATLTAITQGFALGAYEFLRYVTPKEDDDYDGVRQVTLLTPDDGGLGAVITAQALTEGINLARDLVNEPPQALTPDAMSTRAQAIASTHDLTCTIFDENDLEIKGFNLIMAVGKGSINPPRLIHLVYTPKDEVIHKVAFVGKGVTFDTGGNNIKTGGYMLNMHSDMAGGAAVLGAAESIGRLKPAGVEVHFIVPTAENSVSGRAMRPNDIYRGYGKKTVEIGNTDAEGRLILADALAYAQEQGVDTIVDLATLTGACVVALGEHTSAMFSDSDALVEQLSAATEESGEDFWRMPLNKKLDSQLDTPHADMKNIGKRYGGAITAALFLKRWVKIERWAHLDIAGPAFMEGPDDSLAAGGTGFGVSTLVALAQRLGS